MYYINSIKRYTRIYNNDKRRKETPNSM